MYTCIHVRRIVSDGVHLVIYTALFIQTDECTFKTFIFLRVLCVPLSAQPLVMTTMLPIIVCCTKLSTNLLSIFTQ